MIDPRHITIGLLLGATVVLTAWAIYAATNKVPNRHDTISHVVNQYGRRYWAIPFAAGVLIGHFWITGVPWRPVHPVVTGFVLIPVTAAVTLLGFRLPVERKRHWAAIALGLVTAGMAFGCIAWPI